MKTSTQRCSQLNWRTFIAGGFKTFLVLFLLSFIITDTNAQITVDGQPSDWCSVIGGLKPNLHVKDVLNGNNDDTEFTEGTSDVLDIPDWVWGIGNISDKTDLGNVGLVVDGCTVYFFADRYAANGDADLGLWLFKNPAVSLNPDGSFNGTHLEGDILITSKFTNGGGEQTTKVYIWTGGQLVLLFDTALDASKESIASGTVNSSQQTVPCGWEYKSKTDAAGIYPIGTFYEGRIDLCLLEQAYTQYSLAINECFANFIFKTSQSPQPTSANGDLVFGNINSLPAEPELTGSAFCTGTGTGTVSVANSSASVRYYLEKSDGGGWVPIANSLGNGGTLTFMDLAAGTYRVRAVNINTISLCETISDNVEVSAITVNGGTGSENQTVCSGGDPSVLSVTGASTGTYQWQSNITGCDGSWVNIGGATSATYDPPSGLTTTTYYRRKTTVNTGGVLCDAYSTCITVMVNNVTAGTIAGSQTLCSPADPAAFTVTVAATGSATPTYKWESKPGTCAEGGTWTVIGGATTATYDVPAGLMATTSYRRIATSTVNGVPCDATSNCITVTVNNVTGGTIAGNQTLCSPANPDAFTSTTAATGTATPTYQWQSKPGTCEEGGTWTNIGGATSATYDVPAGLTTTTSYRRVATSTVNGVECSANSNCITVSMNAIDPGVIAGGETLCSPANPAAFTSVTPASGATTPTYQWESKPGTCQEGGTWVAIGGATSATYDVPAGLTATTSYRRVATSTVNGVPCSANSNCITVTVKPTPAPPVLSVINNCESSTISAKDAGGALIPEGELTWSNGMNGNPIVVTTTTSVTAYRTVDGCPSANSNSVTPAPKPTPGAPTGIAASGCIGQQLTLGASGCTGTYKWYATNISTEVLGMGSTFLTPVLNGNATYFVSCTVDGCEGPRTAVMATVADCGSFCTYTQGYFGNGGGKSCDGETGGLSTIQLINQSISNWGGTILIGSGTRSVSINTGDAQKVIDYLPGGGQSYALSSPAIGISSPSFASLYTSTVGGKTKINNTLLAQTITLGINLGINDDLATFSFASHSAVNKYLVTQELESCGGNVGVPDSYTCDELNTAVVALLKQANWPAGMDYPATVAGLFQLANYALGGGSLTGTGVTMSSIAGAVDAINNAFDECRLFIGFRETCPAPSTTKAETESLSENSVSVTAFPNPYTDRVRFVLRATISGQAALEIYNSMGQRVATPFRGFMNAGTSQVVDYTVPANQRENLFYLMRVNDKQASGKLLNLD